MSAQIEPTDGLCQCGCGQPTSISRWSDRNRGRVSGQPMRYIKGHNDVRSEFASRMRRDATGRSQITPTLVAHLKAWVRTRIAVEASLVIERVGERNRVSLRYHQGGAYYEAEVALLDRLRRECPLASPERLRALFSQLAEAVSGSA